MVSEILFLVDAFSETAGQKIKENTFWKVLKDVSTSLEVDILDDNEVEGNIDGRSYYGEIALVTVKLEMMNNVKMVSERWEEGTEATEL